MSPTVQHPHIDFKGAVDLALHADQENLENTLKRVQQCTCVLKEVIETDPLTKNWVAPALQSDKAIETVLRIGLMQRQQT